MLKKIVFAALTLSFFASCSNDSEDDLVPEVPDAGVVATFDGGVQAALGACLNCHSDPTQNGAPFSLTTYEEVSTRATRILGAIKKESGFAPMPPSGDVSSATIALVEKWIADGLPEK